MKTRECNDCGKRYKKLTEEGICYYCHYGKYKSHPKEWEQGKKVNN